MPNQKNQEIFYLTLDIYLSPLDLYLLAHLFVPEVNDQPMGVYFKIMKTKSLVVYITGAYISELFRLIATSVYPDITAA